MIGRILCRLGLHREFAQERRRFEIVNAQRFTVVGWLDRRICCGRCGSSLSEWKNVDFSDFSDADFSPSILAQLDKEGKAIVEFLPKLS
jgi:hypothetical protein